MFSTPVPDITNLKARITDAFATITEDMLENTCVIDYRLDLRATTGAHTEVYLCVVIKTLELSYILKKKYIYIYVSIPSRFLVINVCNQ